MTKEVRDSMMKGSLKHTLFQEHPGRVYLDAWGWEAGLYYQRDLPYGENLDYFKSKVIDESYKWGCNSLDVYLQAPPPPIDRDALSMRWDLDDPIEGAIYYRYIYDPKWDNANLMRLTKYAHSRDMLFDWYINEIPMKDREEGGRGRDLIYNLLEKIARDFMNPLVHGWQGSLDGIKEEDIPFDILKADQVMWRYNPGAFIAPRPPNGKFPNIVPPNMIAFYACGRKGRHDGRDPLRKEHSLWHTSYSRIFVTYQGSSRTNRISSARWGNYFAAFSGGIFPDLILKQCNDYFRSRAKNPEDIHETVISWLGEPLNVCPKEVRRYVFAVSQDPIKCAISASEASISPAKVSFIQNNYLRAYSLLEKEGSKLLYDPEGLAHFDEDSLSFPLSQNFVRTVYSDQQGRVYERKITPSTKEATWVRRKSQEETYEKRVSFPEPGGYKSILREDFIRPSVSVVDGVFEMADHESREFIMFSDTPSLQLRIRRTLRDTEGTTSTIIDCEGYDRLVVEDKLHDAPTEISLSHLGNIFRLEDSSQTKPHLVIFLLEKGKITSLRWVPSKEITFESLAVQYETIDLGFVVPTTLYSLEQMSLLREAMLDEDIPVELKNDGASITNKYKIPLVKVLRISNPDEKPYLVKEYGWWMFRGSNPSSKEKGVDYLKVYLEPKGKAEILRYGFIDDVVKPGWGCQYILAFKDIRSNPSGASCIAKVMSITPLIFSPRLHFKESFSEVKLNGKLWHYFDGCFVFLPNQPGSYQVEVSREGEIVPHITRTFALVKSTEWTGTELVIETGLPQYAEKLPSGLDLYAALDMRGYHVKEIEGGKIIRSTPDGTVISFKLGKIKISVD